MTSSVLVYYRSQLSQLDSANSGRSKIIMYHKNDYFTKVSNMQIELASSSMITIESVQETVVFNRFIEYSRRMQYLQEFGSL